MAKTTKNVSTKTVSAKTKAAKKVTKKVTVDESRKIKAFAGNESHFYKGFPRQLAYQILLAAPKKTMPVGKFLDSIEALKSVKSRGQARGIVQKLVGKPSDDGTLGTICTFV